MSDQTEAPLFVIDDDPQVDWPVSVRLPVDGGAFAIFQFAVRMRVLSESAYRELLDAPAPSAVPEEAEAKPATSVEPMADSLARNADRFAQVITGWSGITRVGGGEVPFTVEALREQVTGPRGVWLSVGLYQALNEVRYGARLGNFAPLSVAG